MSSTSVTAKVEAVQAAINRALNNKTGQAFADIANFMGDLEASARETMQAQLNAEFGRLIYKLENGQPLTAAEQTSVRQLVVGEIKYYLQRQPSTTDWETRLQDLADEISSAGAADTEQLLRLQALCKSGRGLVADIAFYYKEKERLERFETAINGPIDRETGALLADVLRGMITSDTM